MTVRLEHLPVDWARDARVKTPRLCIVEPRKSVTYEVLRMRTRECQYLYLLQT